MKKLLSLLLLSCIVSVGYSQSKSFEKFKNKYKGHDDVNDITVSGNLFGLVGNIAELDEDDEDAQVVARIAKNIQKLEVVTVPKNIKEFDHDEVKNLRKGLKKEAYEVLIQVKDGKETIDFLAGPGKNSIKNMLVLIEEDDSFVVLNIDGLLNLKDLSYLAKHHKDWD